MPAVPTWPKGLPYKPEKSGYRENIEPAMEVTEFESGDQRQRLKRSRPRDARTVVYAFTQEEFRVFHTFWDRELRQGASRFRMRVLDKRGNWELHIVLMQGGKWTREDSGAFFGDDPVWRVSFTMVVISVVLRETEDA